MIQKEFVLKVAIVLTAWNLAWGVRGAIAQSTTPVPVPSPGCETAESYSALKAALVAAVSADHSGLNNQLWATIVDHDGTVCAIAFSGANRLSEPPYGRVFSAQKASTANGFSTDGGSFSNGTGQPSGLTQSTANIYSFSQPGGILWGYDVSNPVDPTVVHAGPSAFYGSVDDPMVGKKPGGVNVTAGGLALYDVGHKIVGAVGVSGDTPCKDHNVAWLTRHNLGLDHMAASGSLPPVAAPAALFAGDTAHPDNIVYDITPNPNGGTGVSKSGIGHPVCPFGTDPSLLPPVQP